MFIRDGMFIKETIFIEICPGEVRFLYLKGWFQRWSLWIRQLLNRSSVKEGSGWDFFVLLLNSQNSHLDTSELTEALTEYRRRHCSAKNPDAYLLLPLQTGLIRELNLPWISERYRDSAVGYYIKHEIPVPPEELVYYYSIVEEKEKEFLKIKISAARRENISRYINCMLQAGYNLKGIEYAVNAIGETLSNQEDKRLVLLQTIGTDKIQIIMFKGSGLEITKEINIGERNTLKHLFSFGMSESVSPIEVVITDSSSEARRAAAWLSEKGLVKDQPRVSLSDKCSQSECSNLKALAASGYIQKIRQGKSKDLYTPFLLPGKLRTMTVVAVLCLSILLILGLISWYPLQRDSQETFQKIAYLQTNLDDLMKEQSSGTLSQWNGLEEKSRQDMAALQKVFVYIENYVTLVRCNYRQGKLQIWAECNDNSAISALTGKLIADGWKDPVLLSYKYYQNSITFSLSVNR